MFERLQRILQEWRWIWRTSFCDGRRVCCRVMMCFTASSTRAALDLAYAKFKWMVTQKRKWNCIFVWWHQMKISSLLNQIITRTNWTKSTNKLHIEAIVEIHAKREISNITFTLAGSSGSKAWRLANIAFCNEKCQSENSLRKRKFAKKTI